MWRDFLSVFGMPIVFFGLLCLLAPGPARLPPDAICINGAR
jgi:hypothetical protein